MGLGKERIATTKALGDVSVLYVCDTERKGCEEMGDTLFFYGSLYITTSLLITVG